MKLIPALFLFLSLSLNYIQSDDCSNKFNTYISMYCSPLKAESPYTCSFSNNKCEPQKIGCTTYTGTDEEECKSYKPTDKSNKCEIDDGKCKEVNKVCGDYIKGEDDCSSLMAGAGQICFLNGDKCEAREDSCTEFSSNINDASICTKLKVSNHDKVCVYSSEKKGCVEQYKTCELYNENTAENDRKDDCNAIQYYDTTNGVFDTQYKCVLENKECRKKKKECNEISDSSLCINYELDDENKMCVYEDGKCKEEYKSCENYKKKNEAECKNIKIYDDYKNINYKYKCIYNNDNNKCEKKELKECSDYEQGQDNRYCNNIKINDYKRCIIDNNKCIERYTECPGDKETVTEEICKSINPIEEYKKCIIDNNKCIEKIKECSEYKGIDTSDCLKCTTSDNNKKCFMENNKCIDKYIYCTSYTGNDKSTCESIIPYDTNGKSILNTKKCALDSNNKCQMVSKECKDITNYQECIAFSPSDNNKNCAFSDDKCYEQYKDCASYNNNGGQVDKTVCESIILRDDTNKCVYNENDKSCTQSQKACADFKIEEYSYLCYIFASSLSYNKCVYSDNTCHETQKTCLELVGESTVDETICQKATTSSSDKKCVLRENKSGCEEIINESNKSNFGLNNTKILLVNFILIIFGLLLD